jgi:hypothetical protein
MRKIYIYAVLILLSHSSIAQTSLRGMYIDHFSNILGNAVKEDSLLQYAQDSSFNYFALYDLQNVNLSNANTANTMGAFIKRARENYGIQYVGAVGENYSTFATKIAPYNTGRSDDHEKFNVFNLEFEFWTASSVNPGGYYCLQYLQQANCSCDTSGGFKFFIDQIHKIDSLAAVQQVISETYVGWFNQGQAQQLTHNVDRILLHAYRTNTSSLFSYSKTRLQYLASGNTSVDVAPIFSAEPNFMGPWLNSHTQLDAYNQYETDLANDGSSFLQNINILGYQWFTWRFMPQPVPGTSGSFAPVISSSGSTNICPGGAVTLTATHGDSYSWSSGETTQSITVNASLTSSCTVTYNGNTQTTPSVTVSLKNSPTVSVAEGTASPGIVSLSANAAAGSGTISTYQWKLNNASITGATAVSYNASASGLYSVSVTNSFGCSASSAGQNITVSGTACNASVPTGLTSTPITEISQTLRWAAGQTGDSLIVRYHPDSSSTYEYVNMPNEGQTSCILSNLLPNTLYSWRIKTVCGSSSSAYSSKDYFSTGASTSGIPHVRDVTTGDDEESSYLIYPNPVQSELHVDIDNDIPGDGSIKITDVNGRIVQTENINLMPGKNIFTINTSVISDGLYFISISSDQLKVLKKFVITH